ncbi:MAG: hypothetical protein KUG81_07595 [Gammaproteobacteria bacterium]|nr:hypothetical protein [Gammaproteobacteria bacterium]
MRKLTKKQEVHQTNLKAREISKRYHHRNWEAMRWCNKQGLTIYVSAQAHDSSLVKIFVQKGVPFRPLNDIEYSQNDPEDVMKYISAIDAEYERLYLKMKDRVK